MTSLPLPLRRFLLPVTLCTGLVLAAGAHAQIDPRAAELLRGAQTAPAVPLEPGAMELTTASTVYRPDGGIELRSRGRTVVDYRGRRIRSETYMDGELMAVTVYAGGQASMYLTQADRRMPLPADQVAALAASFDTSQPGPAGLIPADYDSASYDGEVSYAGVVEGEQVTTTIRLPTGESVPTSFIFNRKGELLATVQHSPQLGIVLQVFEHMVVSGGLMTRMDSTLYKLDNNRVVRFSESQLNIKVLEGPAEAGLFELPR